MNNCAQIMGNTKILVALLKIVIYIFVMIFLFIIMNCFVFFWKYIKELYYIYYLRAENVGNVIYVPFNRIFIYLKLHKN